MPYTLRVIQSATSLEVTTSQTDTTVRTDNVGGSSPEVSAAKTGTLGTRTDNDTGVIAAAAGHGIISTDKIDVFWDGGQRRGMTATVAGDDITIDGGTGDNLPDEDTELTFMKPHEETVTIVGNNIKAIHVISEQKGFVVFQQADGTHIFAVKIGDGGDSYIWYDDSGEANPVFGANPLAGVTLGKILTSHDDSDEAYAITASVFYN